MNGLKLFVVGESSGNPKDWLPGWRRAFVFAASKDEALRIAELGAVDAAEIIANEPAIFCEEWFNEKSA